MKYFQKVSIEQFVTLIITEDRETGKIIDNWNIERDEIIKSIVSHYHNLGIFMVEPLDYAKTIYRDIQFQVNHNPDLRDKLLTIKEEILKQKAKHSRR